LRGRLLGPAVQYTVSQRYHLQRLNDKLDKNSCLITISFGIGIGYIGLQTIGHHIDFIFPLDAYISLYLHWKALKPRIVNLA